MSEPVPEAIAPLPAAEQREQSIAWTLLLLNAAAFFLFALSFVRRLTNAHFGDVEFTGWSGPIAARLALEQRPYVDFVLPIPPGSFVVLAAIQKLAGRPMLIQELWLNTIVQLVMSVFAYAIAARITTRINALLVSFSTLIALTWLNKECAYDHTAQLVVWGSFVTGSHALLAEPGRIRRRLWVLTGFLTAFTLAFKQSTGLGALLGWGLAVGYLVVVERVSKEHASVKNLLGDAAAFAAGAALGVAALWLMLLSLGSSFAAYAECVFIDGPAVKGGSSRLIRHVLGYLSTEDAWTSSVVFTIGLAAIFARVVLRRGGLHIGDEPARREPFDRRRIAALVVAAVLPFALAIALLSSTYRGIHEDAVIWLDRLKEVPHFGLVFAVAFFLAHLGKTNEGSGPPRAGHALNALMIAALATSLLHNTSAPEFRAFYDNNPIIPLAFLFLYIGVDRAGLGWLRVLLVALTLGSLFGNRIDRAMAAKAPIGKQGYWAGMRVGPRAVDLAHAALQVRSLTGPDDTVLVLPEDVQLAALIGRPRPALRGAIVFVDQYPRRLVPADIQELRRKSAKVLVLHPAETHLWTQLFRIWSGDSGAQQVLDFGAVRADP